MEEATKFPFAAAELTVAIIASAVAIFTFFRVIYYQKRRYLIEKSKYATDMIKEWNTNSACDTNIIQHEFSDYYNDCEPIPLKKIEEKILEDKSFRDSVKRLFNYFEYVATAYDTSAEKRVIEKSFTLTIIRYAQMLENYLLYQLYNTKRNHWIPVTEFVAEQVKSRQYICKFCKKEEEKNKPCFIYENDYRRLLVLFNKEYLTDKEREEVEERYKKRYVMKDVDCN